MKTTGLFLMVSAMLAVVGNGVFAGDYGARYFTTPQTSVTYSTEFRETRAVQYPNGMTTAPTGVLSGYNPHLTFPNQHLTYYGNPHLGAWSRRSAAVHTTYPPVYYPPYPVYPSYVDRRGYRQGWGNYAPVTPVVIFPTCSYPVYSPCQPVPSSYSSFSIRIGW